ncbi:MAG: aminotransferase class I/II-fold pyridoxal phosphate-dependent enzyme [Bacteroides sp.]|nr:aminotransferase class I/II-fold pyridoxal phosphate-dependent enzyme [Prevotella sp.]MCM1407730.1 aminotransferase class I/II-fold pyridoxal phosphate-dependent enzyme [Treponema brennaborense]MCM1469120.1 aminotransferase class I/II-fold pyridoxal phosphate-dependent enzyme [Bacteroides sp.]
MIHPLAQELNEILSSCPVAELFSDLGRRIFFPKGIISQGAEAKQFGKKANATIGITMNDGLPVTLPSVCRQLPELTTSETVAYAPTAGLPALRSEWKAKIIEKNPLLEKKSFSQPVVVPGLTAGISYLCDLFLNEGETLLACNPCWDNYNLIVEARRSAVLKQFEMFRGDAFSGGFNIESFQSVVEKQAETGMLKIILNFPQNPSGYSPTKQEVKQICSVLKKIAEKGTKVLVLCDDAYFGLDYEDDIEPQSLFAFLADLHENIVTVKIDGPTKEDYVWGFRCGFLSFAGKALTDAHHDALVKKLMGIIRSSVSCCATPSQSILLKIFDDPELEAEKQVFKTILKGRYDKVRAFIADKQNHPVLTPLPFNSGYFMCFSCRNIDAEKLRCKLLHEYEIGTIAIDGRYLRIAFSSLDKRDITDVYSAVYEAAEKLAGV